MSAQQPVLVLGAGINGCAIARELALNRVPVCVVDIRDIASGATAYSSRLIHGGLRYLEYGEFDLVRESLEERARLLRLAPQYVHPLELFIPTASRFGGLVGAAAAFLGWQRGRPPSKGRGVALLRMGLGLYDAYARDPSLPRHACRPVSDPASPPVDKRTYRWLCSYHDAQITFPERFTLALIQDARSAAVCANIPCDVFTYHEAALSSRTVTIRSTLGGANEIHIEPQAIINATGAWVDATLARLAIPSRRLIGGTKGSHLLTFHPGLLTALGGRGIYTEAADGRPIFILPLAGAVLIGTTDLPFSGDPAAAVATEPEIEYLLGAANAVFPQFGLSQAVIAFHYSGVRPLPFTPTDRPAAITRRHWLEPNDASQVPLYSVIGGKLTTCRSLAEQTVAVVLKRLHLPQIANSRERPIPGAEDPGWLSPTQVPGGSTVDVLRDTQIPLTAVRAVIADEWARTLSDLVERRLMLLYHQPLTRRCLAHCAELMVEAGVFAADEQSAEVEKTERHLLAHYGRRLDDSIAT